MKNFIPYFIIVAMVVIFPTVVQGAFVSRVDLSKQCCVAYSRNAPNSADRSMTIDCSDVKTYPNALNTFADACTREGLKMVSNRPGSFFSVEPQSCADIPECEKGYVSPVVRPQPSGGGASSGGDQQRAPISFKLPNLFDFDFTLEGLGRGLGRIVSFLLSFVGVLALLMFVWGGFLWLTSAGEEEKVKKGVDTMKWAAIGTLLAFGSFVLLTYFLSAFRAVEIPPTNTAKTK